MLKATTVSQIVTLRIKAIQHGPQHRSSGKQGLAGRISDFTFSHAESPIMGRCGYHNGNTDYGRIPISGYVATSVPGCCPAKRGYMTVLWLMDGEGFHMLVSSKAKAQELYSTMSPTEVTHRVGAESAGSCSCLLPILLTKYLLPIMATTCFTSGLRLAHSQRDPSPYR
jgi:hypothetical protein